MIMKKRGRNSRIFLAKNHRGQVWVETVIYTLIAFVLIGAVLAIAQPRIEEIQDKAFIEQSFGVMKDIDNIILSLAQGGVGNKRVVELGLKKGNLIIDGHYDDNFGKPAVFWELKKVKPGDKVIVTDGAGEDFVYIVSKVYFLDIDSSEKSRVFSSNEKVATITLITCGGVWLPGESTYSKRLIVSGVLDSGANGLAKALMSYYVASYVN